MNPIGAGIDIIDVSRVREILEGTGRDAFMRKVYTPEELRSAKQHSDPNAFLARTFAAKEAVFKTFGIPGSEKVRLCDIAIGRVESGRPTASLSGYLKELAQKRRVSRVLLSMSYDGDYAIAMAVLERKPASAAHAASNHAEKAGRNRKQSISVPRRNRLALKRGSGA